MVQSAGILLYRFSEGQLQVMLVHPGGPYWAKKDARVWSIPKGEFAENERSLDAAKREFHEETGFVAEGKFVNLGRHQQPSKKMVHCWGLKMDLDTSKIQSNTFQMEWPKGTGLMQEYPEVDRGEWFSIGEARQKILKGQEPFLDKLIWIAK